MDVPLNKVPISVSWSGGKDAAFALWRILQNPEYDVIELHTLINEDTQRVGLHGIRKELIMEQADLMGLPVHFLELRKDSTNASFEEVTAAYYKQLKLREIFTIGFGDIFLEDLKSYRDQLLAQSGMVGLYPIWNEDTTELAATFIQSGFRTTICAANPDLFDMSVAGAEFTHELLSKFPSNIDPCGENGEFHSFVHAGPIFNKPLEIRVGKKEIHEYQFKNQDGNNMTSKMEFADIHLSG